MNDKVTQIFEAIIAAYTKCDDSVRWCDDPYRLRTYIAGGRKEGLDCIQDAVTQFARHAAYTNALHCLSEAIQDGTVNGEDIRSVIAFILNHVEAHAESDLLWEEGLNERVKNARWFALNHIRDMCTMVVLGLDPRDTAPEEVSVAMLRAAGADVSVWVPEFATAPFGNVGLRFADDSKTDYVVDPGVTFAVKIEGAGYTEFRVWKGGEIDTECVF